MRVVIIVKLFPKLKLRKSSRGAAAMLVTTTMALLFVTLVVALSWLSISEQRLAGDVDMNGRAIASAEAGIKDAFALLQSDPSHRENCDTPDAATKENWKKNNIQCREIYDKPGPIRIFARQDQTRKSNVYSANYTDKPDSDGDPTANAYKNTGVRYATDFEIYWCKVESHKACSTTNGTDYFPSYYSYIGNNYPPTLELEFVYWKNDQGQPPVLGNGNVNLPAATSINASNYYRLAACAACANRAIDDPSVVNTKTVVLYPKNNQPDISPLPSHHQTNGTFTTSCGYGVVMQTGGYWCKSNRVNLSQAVYGDSDANAYQYRLIFSVTPRYQDSYIEARFYNKNIKDTDFGTFKVDKTDNIVPVPASSIIIDVTAKAGNIYRRLTAYFAKSSDARANINNGLYSGVDICKNMGVSSGNVVTESNEGGCNFSNLGSMFY